MFTWHMMCTTHTLKADMVNKIVIKIFIWEIEMSHQHLYLKNQIKQKLIIWIKKKKQILFSLGWKLQLLFLTHQATTLTQFSDIKQQNLFCLTVCTNPLEGKELEQDFAENKTTTTNWAFSPTKKFHSHTPVFMLLWHVF